MAPCRTLGPQHGFQAGFGVILLARHLPMAAQQAGLVKPLTIALHRAKHCSLWHGTPHGTAVSQCSIPAWRCTILSHCFWPAGLHGVHRIHWEMNNQLLKCFLHGRRREA